ncbi:MAG: hypothetical protein DRJ03_19400 [Chloroflexi bacterium]|nr:MAG: hypothetical protein DRJ03_19400 [Chloroflexota bacterium]
MGFFELGPPFPPEWTGKPPGLLPEDWPLWEAFRQKFADQYSELYFNVAMSLRDPPEGLTPELIRSWIYSFGKRIDVVGVRSKEAVDIIEVTSRAGLRTAGQVLTYLSMWNKLHPLPGQALGVIVTSNVDEDVMPLIDASRLVVINPFL